MQAGAWFAAGIPKQGERRVRPGDRIDAVERPERAVCPCRGSSRGPSGGASVAGPRMRDNLGFAGPRRPGSQPLSTREISSPSVRSQPDDAARAQRQLFAGGDLCRAHAGPVPGAAGLRAGGGALSRRQRPGPGRPGHGHLWPDPGHPAIAVRHGLGPARPQARDHLRPAGVRGRQLPGGLGADPGLAHRRPVPAGRRRGVGGGHRPVGRPDPRRGPHQGHGAGGRQHRADVRAVAGGRAAAGRADRPARPVRRHRRAGAAVHRGGGLVDAARAAAAQGSCRAAGCRRSSATAACCG